MTSIIEINKFSDLNLEDIDLENINISKFISQTKSGLQFNTNYFISEFSQTLDITLTEDQINGLLEVTNFLVSDNCIFGLYGYAGTGKTSIIIKYVYYLLNNNYISGIAISAPTNIAVDILKSKFKELYEGNMKDIKSTMITSLDDIVNYYQKKEYSQNILFTTVHKLLGLKSDLDIDGKLIFVKGNNYILKKYSIIIVDECSMLTSDIVDRFLDDLISLSKKFNTKIIFLGDPAQLPPVNLEKGVNDSIVFNKKITFETFNKDLKKELLKFNTFTMKNIVRTNDQTIINLCNEIRKWITGEIKVPMLKNFRGNKIKYYNFSGKFTKVEHKWFATFLKYKKANNNKSIILTWTNLQTNTYNYTARRLLSNHIPAEYEKGDTLIMNSFCDLQSDAKSLPYSLDSVPNSILYTSEQITVINVVETSFTFSTFNKPTIKIPELTLAITKCASTIAHINKQMERKINVWKLYVQKHSCVETDNYILVCKKESYHILEQNKKVADGKIKKLITYFSKHHSTDFDTITDLLIKPLWSEYKAIFEVSLANVSYGNSITTHKAQGSNFNNVFIDAHDILSNSNIEEKKKCLYTAMTRVSDEIHILL